MKNSLVIVCKLEISKFLKKTRLAEVLILIWWQLDQIVNQDSLKHLCLSILDTAGACPQYESSDLQKQWNLLHWYACFLK